ncbi:sodium/glutamate symporter [Helicobacter apodemus]|uniref:Sodium/glutamate symporter n=1 Tax=Helicobacter apodemus TaxID=135569 RepID=A0A4U8UFK1_9HELI|nr:sodium/glutamate symporter [Helicobacter apodemus]TLE15604.1 sodium/glutamate symporter [Helicobacter apodemus]
MTIDLNFYATLVALVGVLLLGRWVISKSKFLQDYNIPEPVVGGIIIAIGIFCLLKYSGIKFSFNDSLREPLMLAFYASIGLSADFTSLRKGGRILFIFLMCVALLLFLQNITGIFIAKLMGINPLIGLLAGSITMSGGHGTGASWAEIFKANPYNLNAGLEIALACATFGLIAGGLIGGPISHYLIRKYHLQTISHLKEESPPQGFEKPEKERLITAYSFVQSLALIALALLFGTLLSEYFKSSSFTLPTFVWCLFIGAILRNLLSLTKIHQVFDREVSVIGNVSLSLFLAFALMTINLSELVALALPMFAILTIQVILMVAFAIFITFRFCGKDYDAAVLAAGHCGFGLGATPTAMANIQTITQHYGMSHIAFIIVPLVGAFFIDIINAIIISTTLQLPFF